MILKYYIEIVLNYDNDCNIIQSTWFDTEKEAIEFAEKISILRDGFSKKLIVEAFSEDGMYLGIISERDL